MNPRQSGLFDVEEKAAQLTKTGDPLLGLKALIGWEALHSAPLVTIAAHQWHYCNDTIARDLQNLPTSDWCQVAYTDLVENPQATLMQIAHFLELDKDKDIQALLAQSLPVSKLTVSRPAANKWRKYAAEISTITLPCKNANETVKAL